MAYHQQWVNEVKLDYQAAGVLEHQGWCRALDLGLSYDFLDVSRSACMELGARRVQMIHDEWKHKMPQLSATGSDINDDSFLILGMQETSGNLAMAPELVKWLGEELSKDAFANKERRKAREERALAATKK